MPAKVSALKVELKIIVKQLKQKKVKWLFQKLDTYSSKV